MATKSLSFRHSAAARDSFLTTDPLSLESLIRRVEGPERGAIVTFSGTIRATENATAIAAIRYEAYDAMAEAELAKIVESVRTRWNASVAIQHRIGRVSVGEPSLVVACASAHRREAFEACACVVDEIKKNVPIWKVAYEWL